MEFVFTNAIATSSSAMQAAYFNYTTNELAVHFWGGSVIKYTGFTRDDYRAFTNAMSKGRYYTTAIKGVFHGTKLDDNTKFVHVTDKTDEPQLLEAAVAPSVQVTVNIYVSGNPDDIAKAVERLAPSIKAVQNWSV